MSDFKSRLKIEFEELDGRLQKLIAFQASEAFSGLPAEDQNLLNEQAGWMRGYHGVLSKRIARLG